VSVNGYHHERTVLSCTGDPAHVAMPGVHRISALLKRWLLGIHQGAVRRRKQIKVAIFNYRCYALFHEHISRIEGKI
jgi:hypothetical protein